MHSFEHGGIVFNYNGDLSGEVLMRIPVSNTHVEEVDDTIRADIPADVLLAFVAHVVRLARLSRLEATLDDMNDHEVLGLCGTNFATLKDPQSL